MINVDQSAILHKINNHLVNGVGTKVYTKYFTGTTDADNNTQITHNEDFDKILQVTAHIFDGGTTYRVYDYAMGADANNAYHLRFATAVIHLDNVGVNLQSENYCVKMDYIL